MVKKKFGPTLPMSKITSPVSGLGAITSYRIKSNFSETVTLLCVFDLHVTLSLASKADKQGIKLFLVIGCEIKSTKTVLFIMPKILFYVT